MTRIRIHNPCNEHTRYFRYYNYFWDKFTDFLKTKFEVEENRYFENAHFERFKIELQKGTSDEMLLLECEYVIENLDNGEFVVMTVSDDLGYAPLVEKENPFFKKCLISQFIPHKIESHTKENFYKYSPWTYFQCTMTNLEDYREKRKNIDNKIDKLYFRGDERGRKILNHINHEILDKPARGTSESYFEEVINYSVGLSVGGVGEICYRDIEYMALGIPFIRFEYQTQISPPLIPNYHYISIPFDETFDSINNIKLDRLGGTEHASKIEEKYYEIIHNKELLNRISENARKYYDENLTIEKLISNTYNLLEIDDWVNNSSNDKSIINYERPKTIFLDIDGTLVKHSEDIINQINDPLELIDGTLEKLIEWDRKGYNIILTTGRRESHRTQTEKQLTKLGIFYDKLIMGIGGGDRVLINDRKKNKISDTAFAVNLDRNEGIKNIQI
jgi:hypothetical protein